MHARRAEATWLAVTVSALTIKQSQLQMEVQQMVYIWIFKSIPVLVPSIIANMMVETKNFIMMMMMMIKTTTTNEIWCLNSKYLSVIYLTCCFCKRFRAEKLLGKGRNSSLEYHKPDLLLLVVTCWEECTELLNFAPPSLKDTNVVSLRASKEKKVYGHLFFSSKKFEWRSKKSR